MNQPQSGPSWRWRVLGKFSLTTFAGTKLIFAVARCIFFFIFFSNGVLESPFRRAGVLQKNSFSWVNAAQFSTYSILAKQQQERSRQSCCFCWFCRMYGGLNISYHLHSWTRFFLVPLELNANSHKVVFVHTWMPTLLTKKAYIKEECLMQVTAITFNPFRVYFVYGLR